MLLVDMETLDVLYAQDAGQPWHPASLTKLMTAYVTFEEIAKGTITLDTPVVLSKHAVAQAPVRSGLKVGSALTLKDALYIMVVKSANDVAMAIAETVGGSEAGFVAKMNDVAARMGLTASHFANPNGLHDPSQVMSARDLALLALYIQQSFPQYVPMFGTEAVQLGKASLESENELLTSFAGTTGMKTGYVCASGLNMVATVERNGRKMLAVVLGGSSSRERNERAAELILKGLSGAARPTGRTVLTLGNNPGAPVVDMRPQICGKEAKAYSAAQKAAFPMGLKGEPSYLTDVIPPRVYVATDLGRLAIGVSLPRPRPAHMPQFVVPDSQAALANTLRPGLDAARPAMPMPLPRPSRF
ncbi:MAG: D-alanyl-D-alanine carboxypeptidase family protein [Devosia sp.]